MRFTSVMFLAALMPVTTAIDLFLVVGPCGKGLDFRAVRQIIAEFPR